MNKPLWAEMVSLLALIVLFIGGCGTADETSPPPPKPSVTVTVQENSEKLVEVEVLYEHHSLGNMQGWAKVTFSTAEEAEAYRTQLEFAVVKLKESEEKMKNVWDD